MNFAEHNLLSEAESEFNLTVFYGRDAEWTSVLNACKRYPMFAEKQVVLLKEAQQMKDIEKLESYMESPLDSTIFVVGYKTKPLDKRTKIYKIVSKNAEMFTTVKIKEEKVQDWIAGLLKEKGYTMPPRAISLLEEHIGNDLSRLANEIDKLALNLSGKKYWWRWYRKIYRYQ